MNAPRTWTAVWELTVGVGGGWRWAKGNYIEYNEDHIVTLFQCNLPLPFPFSSILPLHSLFLSYVPFQGGTEHWYGKWSGGTLDGE